MAQLEKLLECSEVILQHLPWEGRKYVVHDIILADEVVDNYSFGHNINNINDLSIILFSHIGVDLPKDLE